MYICVSVYNQLSFLIYIQYIWLELGDSYILSASLHLLLVVVQLYSICCRVESAQLRTHYAKYWLVYASMNMVCANGYGQVPIRKFAVTI